MTPVGHFSTSMFFGTLSWTLSGSPIVGGIVALLTHIPADLVLNEFYKWGPDWESRLSNYIKMVVSMTPAIILLVLVSLEHNMTIPAIFGLMGIVPDVLDETFTKVFGFPLFPCHYGSPFYIPRLFGRDSFVRMSSLGETVLIETSLAMACSIITLWMIGV